LSHSNVQTNHGITTVLKDLNALSVEKAYPTSEDKTIRFATQHTHAARRRFAATRSADFGICIGYIAFPIAGGDAADAQTVGRHCATLRRNSGWGMTRSKIRKGAMTSTML